MLFGGDAIGQFVPDLRDRFPGKTPDNRILSSLKDESGKLLFSKSFHGDDTVQSDAVSERFLSGANADDNFGYSVSGAGDVNGDGFDDIIVGAPSNDFAAAECGRAYIYFGGTVFNSNPDVIITGGAAGYLLGISVANAGDVNGDSYGDVIVGAQGYNSNQGRAFIYYGGQEMNSTADLIFTGEIIGDYFGYSVCGAGDLNGDGFADVVVGAPYNSSSTGKAYVYYGGSPMNNTVDVTMTGSAMNYLFGRSVSSAGDMNADGYSDLVVGAPAYNSNMGRSYVFTGSAAMDNTADLTLTGGATGYLFGASVSSASDVNGDGYSDIAIGANGYSSSRGRVYLYFGGSVLNATADMNLYGESSGDNFGCSVSSAGDFNSDGYDDILIGAYGVLSSSGKAYIYKGGETPDDAADKFLNGYAAGDAFGYSVSNCGDFNGDGNQDVVAGAYLSDVTASNAGRAYLFINSMSGSDLADVVIAGASDNDLLGVSVSSAGDVNGDGYSDVIVGASGYSAGADQGRAYIFYGGPISNNVADVILTGVSASDYFGFSVSGAGDVNGDGYDDVIVGADGYNGGTNQGRAYIFFGGSSMNSTADVTLTGLSAGDHFGFSVSGAGDVNSDGYGDVIVGAYGYNAGTDAGRAYIYFGGSSMNNTVDLTLYVSGTGSRFGYSVSDAGDVNGDGFDDLIVGAYRYNAGTGKGVAYLYHGGINMDIYPDIFILGASDQDYFGYSVSGAGDVNADGYDDIIIGSPSYNAGSNQGRAFVYYGGYAMNTTADVTMTGSVDGDQFGTSVSDAGDVNADGYYDVIAGANGFPAGYSKGRAYVFFGGSAMNNTSDVVYEGESVSDYLGVSVTSAGDLNADGYDDVAVGAPYYTSSSYRGKAYFSFSSATQVRPRIVSAKDVPFDQGGKVALKWMRSGYDALGQSTVTSYRIEMSDPPSGGNYYWELIGSMSASNNLFYQFTANTPNDSMGGNSGVKYFRITAATVDPDQLWRSNIVYAYSVDNLAPLPPLNLAAIADLNSVYLTWDRNLESDMHHYIIFRNGVELLTSTVSYFDDATALEDSTYEYRIAAVDIHGNVSGLSEPVTVIFNNMGNIYLTVAMEGFYDAALNRMRISDTAKVYLRNSVFPYALNDSASSVVNFSTLTGKFNMNHAATGDYYIVVMHRNTVETWSANAVAFSSTGNISYDFTSAVSKAYGNNMWQIDTNPVRFGIYSGDVNKDGTVDATDLAAIDNDAANFVGGYVVTDLTGDNFVDGTDFAIADNNAAIFVSVIRP